MRNKRQIFYRLMSVYKSAIESGRTGEGEGVHFHVPDTYFYFTDSPDEKITRVEVADFLSGEGYAEANEIQEWADDRYYITH